MLAQIKIKVLTFGRRVEHFLIDEWKGGWKLWSVQLNAVGLVLMTFGEAMRDGLTMVPPVIAMRLPHAEHIGMFLFALGILSRLLRQKKPNG